ncbi:helix-turn-helix transcriptional regulator [Piscinibacter sp.]|uniref:helix-turn-helix transcriptional regulator n=1 Tax=Piscinibacter sp. TaxID=1903157 RepID=UPI002CF52714|nr:helix-turn-helix domain-containing protein [Albitalea sp.]HUG21461.1 helix-turn-helix domain-containing protein [Albitalea sp.]
MLLGTFVVPAVRWPPERVRRIVAADDPTEGPALTEAEADVLGALEAAGQLRAAAIAEALNLSAGTTYVRLSRMEARGLIRRAGHGTYAARSA